MTYVSQHCTEKDCHCYQWTKRDFIYPNEIKPVLHETRKYSNLVWLIHLCPYAMRFPNERSHKNQYVAFAQICGDDLWLGFGFQKKKYQQPQLTQSAFHRIFELNLYINSHRVWQSANPRCTMMVVISPRSLKHFKGSPNRGGSSELITNDKIMHTQTHKHSSRQRMWGLEIECKRTDKEQKPYSVGFWLKISPAQFTCVGGWWWALQIIPADEGLMKCIRWLPAMIVSIIWRKYICLFVIGHRQW